MSSFAKNEEGAPDWTMLVNGGITLYRNREFLDEDAKWLSMRGYHLYKMDASAWSSEEEMHVCLQQTLALPDYYGRNLDALDECLADWDVPDAGGAAIVLSSFDRFVRAVGTSMPVERSCAVGLLDAFARASRYHLLAGKRVVLLVQSDDPRIQFEGLGCVAAHWNSREWMNKDRGL